MQKGLPKKNLEEIKKEVDLMDTEGHKVPLKTYGNQGKSGVEDEDKLGDLDIVDEPSEEKLEEERERLEKIKEEDKKKLEEKEKPKFEGSGVKLSKEQEKIVDEKVEEILHPEKEKQEDKKDEEKNSGHYFIVFAGFILVDILSIKGFCCK